MKRRKTPQEKKRLSYERDYVVISHQTCKGGRKSWPRKEARIARAFRRKVNQALGGFDQEPDEIEFAVREIVRDRAKKDAVQTLGEAVAHDLQARQDRHGLHQEDHAFYEARKIAFPSGLSRPRKHLR